jgi:hypothetical protein
MSVASDRKKIASSRPGVLMARLVNPQGRLLHPRLVRSIQYSLYELREGTTRKRLVAGHIGRQLRVEKVVASSLRIGDGWDMDAVGYNFRHRFVIRDADNRSSPASSNYELRYVLTQTTGERSVVCFRVRMVPHD